MAPWVDDDNTHDCGNCDDCGVHRREPLPDDLPAAVTPERAGVLAASRKTLVSRSNLTGIPG
jgi:hypothetical protein